MREVWWNLADLCHVLTIIGCGVATWILFVSLNNTAISSMPDFSSVVGLSFVVIPYCAGRVFESVATRPPRINKDTHSLCPACRRYVHNAATRCMHCHAELTPIAAD